MGTTGKHQSGKGESGTPGRHPKTEEGDQVRKAREWGGGSKASKGPVTRSDKHNENSSAKS